MLRLLAILIVSSLLTAGCGGPDKNEEEKTASPKTTFSRCKTSTNDKQPAGSRPTKQAAIRALDITPDFPLDKPLAAWDKTPAGAHAFAGAVMVSICSQLNDVYKRADLGGAWNLTLIVAQPGMEFNDCKTGKKKLSSVPQVCWGEGVQAPGGTVYHDWIAIYPESRLQLMLNNEQYGAVQASADLATVVMGLALGATFTQLTISPKMYSCAAGTWQGTLVTQQTRVATTNAAFIAATPQANSTMQGITHRSIGKCAQSYLQIRRASSKGALPGSRPYKST